jgi:hypothetical protein
MNFRRRWVVFLMSLCVTIAGIALVFLAEHRTPIGVPIDSLSRRYSRLQQLGTLVQLAKIKQNGKWPQSWQALTDQMAQFGADELSELIDDAEGPLDRGEAIHTLNNIAESLARNYQYIRPDASPISSPDTTEQSAIDANGNDILVCERQPDQNGDRLLMTVSGTILFVCEYGTGVSTINK